MKFKRTVTVVLVLSIVSLSAQETPFSFKWRNGFKVENKDESFKFKFGGRVMLDNAFINQDEDLDAIFGKLETTSAAEIRRARIFFSGSVYNNLEFKLDLDFEGGRVAMKDIFIGIKKIPVIGNVRVGYIKEPFRFEMLTSSKYITFMERSLISDYVPTRNNGILLFSRSLNTTQSINNQ